MNFKWKLAIGDCFIFYFYKITRDASYLHVLISNFFVTGRCRMVLVLNGVLQEECPPDTRSLYHAHPVYRETAAQLLAIPNKVIGPVGLLYVQQRELAATVPHDSMFFLQILIFFFNAI